MKKQTHCKRGHELTTANTYVTPKTLKRVCRQCKRATNERWKQNELSEDRLIDRRGLLGVGYAARDRNSF